MTQSIEDVRKLATLAAEVAIVTPLRLSPRAQITGVPVDLVNRIRAHLTHMGLDWEKMAKEVRE